MSMDAYQLCPCGSGKKVKFCCGPILGEIEKIERQLEGGQQALAIQHLDALRKSHPGNPLVLTQRAGLHFVNQEWLEAKGLLEELLHAHPDHAEGNVMYAWACYVEDGYEASRPALQRAFQRAAGHPQLAATLAGAITDEMLQARKYLAAREYLTLALRWIDEEKKPRVFASLLQLDGDRTIPYALRGPHHLQHWSGTEAENKEFAKATRLAGSTCWDSAARHFQNLADKHPEAAPLWHNLGLSRACMGDEVEAAELLHKAARLHTTDRAAAVEWETIAQLLDVARGPGVDKLKMDLFEIGSVAKLLTKLSQHGRFARQPTPQTEESDEPGIAAQFEILTAPAVPAEQITVDNAFNLPHALGWFVVYDADPEDDIPAWATLTTFESLFEEAKALAFETAAGELSEHLHDHDHDHDHGPDCQHDHDHDHDDASAQDHGLKEPFRTLDSRPYVPPEDIAVRTRREIYRRCWQRGVQETWANAKSSSLNGKSPREAAGNAELANPLAAALIVLDAFSDQHDQAVDLPALFQEYQVAPLDPIHPTAETPVQAFSALQMQRLVVRELADDQLRFVLNRELLSHQPRFLYEVLAEVVNRPSLADKVDLDRVYSSLISVCRQLDRRDEAASWLRKAIDYFRTQPGAFEAVFKWESLEISLRADTPDDPELPDLIRRYYATYSRKIPRLTEILQNLLVTVGVEIPPGLIPSEEGVGATTAGGIWTPDAAAATGGEKKLILPGQF